MEADDGGPEPGQGPSLLSPEMSSVRRFFESALDLEDESRDDGSSDNESGMPSHQVASNSSRRSLSHFMLGTIASRAKDKAMTEEAAAAMVIQSSADRLHTAQSSSQHMRESTSRLPGTSRLSLPARATVTGGIQRPQSASATPTQARGPGENTPRTGSPLQAQALFQSPERPTGRTPAPSETDERGEIAGRGRGASARMPSYASPTAALAFRLSTGDAPGRPRPAASASATAPPAPRPASAASRNPPRPLSSSATTTPTARTLSRAERAASAAPEISAPVPMAPSGGRDALQTSWQALQGVQAALQGRAREASWRAHVREITPERFQCTLCLKNFRAADFVRTHLAARHPAAAAALPSGSSAPSPPPAPPQLDGSPVRRPGSSDPNAPVRSVIRREEAAAAAASGVRARSASSSSRSSGNEWGDTWGDDEPAPPPVTLRMDPEEVPSSLAMLSGPAAPRRGLGGPSLESEGSEAGDSELDWDDDGPLRPRIVAPVARPAWGESGSAPGSGRGLRVLETHREEDEDDWRDLDTAPLADRDPPLPAPPPPPHVLAPAHAHALALSPPPAPVPAPVPPPAPVPSQPPTREAAPSSDVTPRAGHDVTPRTVLESTPRTVHDSTPRTGHDSTPRTVTHESTPRAGHDTTPRAGHDTTPRADHGPHSGRPPAGASSARPTPLPARGTLAEVASIAKSAQARAAATRTQGRRGPTLITSRDLEAIPKVVGNMRFNADTVRWEGGGEELQVPSSSDEEGGENAPAGQGAGHHRQGAEFTLTKALRRAFRGTEKGSGAALGGWMRGWQALRRGGGSVKAADRAHLFTIREISIERVVRDARRVRFAPPLPTPSALPPAPALVPNPRTPAR